MNFRKKYLDHQLEVCSSSFVILLLQLNHKYNCRIGISFEPVFFVWYNEYTTASFVITPKYVLESMIIGLKFANLLYLQMNSSYFS